MIDEHPVQGGGDGRVKKTLVYFLLLIAVNLLLAAAVSADPRMETNNNFCHFILNAENTDNEVFLAGCDSVITVIEKVVTTAGMSVKCEPDNHVASGYASVTKELPAAAVPAPPGSTLTFTSDGSTTACTMVESNGRAYTSNKWTSTIKVNRVKRNGFATVQYEIFCQDGQ
jgi:hypothetical protein